jgi:hypothetical protein
MRSLLLVVPFITGCLLSDDARVAPLSSFRPYTRVSHEGSITFEHFGDNLDSANCLRLPDDIEATLNGIPFEVTERGGAKGSSCVFPVMRLATVPEAASASLVIRDRSTTIPCDLGDTLAPFPLELVPPGAWQLPAGERVTVRATRPADTESLKAELVVGGTVVDLPDQTQSGDDITFTVPGPFIGSSALRVVADHVYQGTADYTRCGGIVFTSHRAVTPITIAP